DSQSRLPVIGPSTPMRDGQDQDAPRFDTVDDAEWKAPKQISARVVLEAGPGIRKTHDRRLGFINFVAESRSCCCATFRIPACGSFRFFEGFYEILKLASHVRLPHGCGDAPLTKEWSWRCPH